MHIVRGCQNVISDFAVFLDILKIGSGNTPSGRGWHCNKLKRFPKPGPYLEQACAARGYMLHGLDIIRLSRENTESGAWST